MKKNEKYDKVIANFDLDFIKNKFDNDNVAAPESLNGENVKNAIDDKEQKIIPFVKTKAFKTAVSLVACVAIVAVSLNFALGRNTQSPPVTDSEIQSENVNLNHFRLQRILKNISNPLKNLTVRAISVFRHLKIRLKAPRMRLIIQAVKPTFRLAVLMRLILSK